MRASDFANLEQIEFDQAVYFDFDEKLNFCPERISASDWRKILWGRSDLRCSYSNLRSNRQSRLGFSKEEQAFKFGGHSLEYKLQKLSLICSPYLDLERHLRVCRELIPTFPNSYAFEWFINSAYKEKDPIKRDIYWHFGISLYKQRCLDIMKHRHTTEVDMDLYYDMCDPYYSDTAKDAYLLEYRRHCEVCHPELDDLVSELRFTHSHFFESMPFWSHPVRDFEYAFKKPKKIEEGKIEEFRDTLYSHLKRLKITLEYRDVLKAAVKKSSIFSAEEGKNVRRYSKEDLLSKFHHVINSKLCYPWQFKRTLIPVSNGNLRDTFVPSIETFAQMVILEDIARQICQNIPEIKIGKRYIPLGPKDNRIYSMIDIKKFGLTFPRELLQLTLEVIADTFHIDISWMINNWKGSEVLVDGAFRKLTRGFGLGNQNFLATLAYWVICKGTGYPFFIYSDDVIFWHSPDQEGLFEIEKYISQFGLEINLKKSYSSKIPEFLGRTPRNSYLEYEEQLATCRLAEAIFTSDDLKMYQAEVQLLNSYPELKRVFFSNHHYRRILRKELLTAPTVCSGYIQMARPEEWMIRHSFSKDWFLTSPPNRRVEILNYNTHSPLTGYYCVYNKPEVSQVYFKPELSRLEERRRNLRILKKIRSGELVDPSAPDSIIFMYSKGLFPVETLEFRKGRREVKILGLLRLGYNPLLKKRSDHYIRFAFDPSNDFIRTLSAFTNFPVETWGILSLRYGRKILRSKYVVNKGSFQFKERIFYQATTESLSLQCPSYQSILGYWDNYHQYSCQQLEMDHYDPMLPDLDDLLDNQRGQRKGKVPKLNNFFRARQERSSNLLRSEHLDIFSEESSDSSDFSEEESTTEKVDPSHLKDPIIYDDEDIYDSDFPSSDNEEEEEEEEQSEQKSSECSEMEFSLDLEEEQGEDYPYDYSSKEDNQQQYSLELLNFSRSFHSQAEADDYL